MTVELPLALVTGASSGIGFELARLLAENGYEVAMCAEDDELTTAAASLSGQGHRVSTIQRDLRDPAEVDAMYDEVRADGRPLAVAALNAGVGKGGAFLDTGLDELQSIIDLNVSSTARLLHRVVGDMVERDDGKVLVTSSIASAVPGSYQAAYNASKSFVQSLTEALQDEVRNSAVVITSLMPGPTDTEFFARADMEDTRMGGMSKDDPADVAQQGYDALMRGDRKVVAASLMTKAQAKVLGLVPDSVKAAAHRVIAEPQDD